MRAITQQALGGPEVLELVDLPQPEPAPTEVLVRVAAAGVNPVDWKVRLRGGFLGDPPFTVGWDLAGTVEKLGPGVTRFAVGDRVFGMPRFPKQAACYAEFVTSPSRQLARTPEGLSDVEAAASARRTDGLASARRDSRRSARPARARAGSRRRRRPSRRADREGRGAYVIGTAPFFQARIPRRAGR